ncbi:MAG: IdeS/Mac family cysteine endopeptidase [Bdellovibrionales bacterium]|nr:IdeS/Mac family cysteine endopeptidase [Bdellovibrionales bacterium]
MTRILMLFVVTFIGLPVLAQDSVTKIILPISRVKMQGHTTLCWVYSTLGTIETNYLLGHPGQSIDLSPSALQLQTWKDRYLRRLDGTEERLIESGAAIDAISLIRTYGLFPEESFARPVKQWDREPLDPFGYNNNPFTFQSLNALLSQMFGSLPQIIEWQSFSCSPRDFASLILGESTWKAYGVSRNGKSGEGAHWDIDARKGALAIYLPLNEILKLIRKSLEHGHAMVVSFGPTDLNEGGHAVQVYGAEYDSQGNPVLYHIKDSNQRDDPRQNIWSMDAEGFNSILRGITTISLD